MVPPALHRVFTACGIRDASATIEGSRNPVEVVKCAIQILHGGVSDATQRFLCRLLSSLFRRIESFTDSIRPTRRDSARDSDPAGGGRTKVWACGARRRSSVSGGGSGWILVGGFERAGSCRNGGGLIMMASGACI